MNFTSPGSLATLALTTIAGTLGKKNYRRNITAGNGPTDLPPSYVADFTYKTGRDVVDQGVSPGLVTFIGDSTMKIHVGSGNDNALRFDYTPKGNNFCVELPMLTDMPAGVTYSQVQVGLLGNVSSGQNGLYAIYDKTGAKFTLFEQVAGVAGMNSSSADLSGFNIRPGVSGATAGMPGSIILHITGNYAHCWIKFGGMVSPVWVLSARIQKFDPRTDTDMAQWRPGFRVATDNVAATDVFFGPLKVYPAGRVGYREFIPATYEDGMPVEINGLMLCTYDNAGPTIAGYASANQNTPTHAALGLYDPHSGTIVAEIAKIDYADGTRTWAPQDISLVIDRAAGCARFFYEPWNNTTNDGTTDGSNYPGGATGNAGINIWHSKYFGPLLGTSRIVLHEHDVVAVPSPHTNRLMYAPGVVKWNGRWYMVCTVIDVDNWKDTPQHSRLLLVSGTSPISFDTIVSFNPVDDGTYDSGTPTAVNGEGTTFCIIPNGTALDFYVMIARRQRGAGGTPDSAGPNSEAEVWKVASDGSTVTWNCRITSPYTNTVAAAYPCVFPVKKGSKTVFHFTSHDVAVGPAGTVAEAGGFYVLESAEYSGWAWPVRDYAGSTSASVSGYGRLLRTGRGV